VSPHPDLLVISDLHLGDEHVKNGLGDELVAFLDHHRGVGRRYRLVVNGDMIDLVGVQVMPGDAGEVLGLHPDDHHYGLGGRAHGALVKLAQVIERNRHVFDALGRFLGAGHEIAIVMGNHDAELHWPEVQELLRETLVQVAGPAARERLSFHPWFFFEDGVAWIEHGHQYDPYCSFEDVLAPATDEEEIDPSLGALLPRYVGSRFADPIHEAWGKGFFGFLAFWVRQGRDRVVAIGQAYIDVCRRMGQHWRARVPERLAARRALARKRLRAVARRFGLAEEPLFELMALARPPVGVELSRIVRALMLDRLLLLLFGPVLLILPFLLAPWSWLPWADLPVIALLAVWSWIAGMAREPVDPTETMRATAGRIRERLQVPIVVMGHSHRPSAEAGYFNTGTWVGEAFTHLTIERTDRGVRARLCQWRDGCSKIFDPYDPT
jgi:UDP-2,3-diacylglucosamine pyrophosphatase LpxH